jgi:hypothetical protein
MDCRCYLRKSIVYIPTQGMMDKGLYRNVEPVAVVPLSNTEALRAAFSVAIARGNPRVALPKQSEIPPPILPKYAGVKSWSIFARDASTWAIDERSGKFKIIKYRKDSRLGWAEDRDNVEEFPAGTTATQVIDRMITILQEAAQTDASKR